MSNLGSVRNFWVPRGVDNFREAMSDEVKRSIEQINRNKEENIAASNQKAEVDPGVQALKTINMSMKAITAGKQAFDKVKTGGKAKKDKKQKEKNDKLNFLAKSLDDKDLIKNHVLFHEGARDVYTSHKKLKDELDAALEAGRINQELYDELSDLSPGSILERKTWQIGNVVESSYSEHEKALKDENSSAYKNLGLRKGDKAAAHSDFLIDQLEPYNLDDKAYSALVYPEAKRQKTTKDGINAIAYGSTSATKRHEEFEQGLKTALKFDANPEDGVLGVYSPSHYISKFLQSSYKGMKATVIANNPGLDPENKEHSAIIHTKTKNRLTGLIVGSAYNLDLKYEQLEALRLGKIEHPAGDTAELLLTNNDWKLIENNITAGTKAVLDQGIAVATNYGKTQLATYLKEPDKYEGDLDKVADEVVRRGVAEGSKLVQRLRNTNLETQDSNSYKVQREEFYDAFLSASPTARKDMLESQITNNRLNDELTQLNTDLNFINSNNKLDDDGFEGEAGDMIMKIIGGGKTIVGNQRISPGSQTTFRDYIQQKFTDIHTGFSLEAIAAGNKNDKTIAQKSRAELYKLLESEGFGIAANDPGAGKLSHTTEGEFPGIQIRPEVESEKQNIDLSTIEGELQHITQTYNTKKEVVNSGKAITNAEFIAFAESDFKIYPPDVLIKAEIIGVDPSELIMGKVNKLKASNELDEQLYANQYNLDKFDLPEEAKGGLNTRKFLENIYHDSTASTKKDAMNLIYALEHSHGLTYNQYIRIQQLERGMNNLGQKAAPTTSQANFNALVKKWRAEGKTTEEINQLIKDLKNANRTPTTSNIT
jgi:hypothetical protein